MTNREGPVCPKCGSFVNDDGVYEECSYVACDWGLYEKHPVGTAQIISKKREKNDT